MSSTRNSARKALEMVAWGQRTAAKDQTVRAGKEHTCQLGMDQQIGIK